MQAARFWKTSEINFFSLERLTFVVYLLPCHLFYGESS